MANELDELTGSVNEEGRDINVIHKQLNVVARRGTKSLIHFLCVITFGLYNIKLNHVRSFFKQLEQKMQKDASTIDNYLEQRVIILQNTVKLLDKAIELDKDTFTKIAIARSGSKINDAERNLVSSQLDDIANKINVAFENYPNLEAHNAIAKAMQQNDYLQREITAARDLYNSTVDAWNREVFEWPTKIYIADQNKYTTRIPFEASKTIKDKAKDVFF